MGGENERMRSGVILVNDSNYILLASCRSSQVEGSEKTEAPCPQTKKIYLHGDWYWSPIQANDVCNIVSPSGAFLTSFGALPVTITTRFPQKSDIDDLLFVVKPESVVSPSYVVAHVSCPRRAVLKHRFKGSSFDRNIPQIVGNLRHELFQTCLSSNDLSDEKMKKVADEIVYGNTKDILTCDRFSEADALKEILAIKPHAQEFANMYTFFPGGSNGEANGATMKGFGCDDLHFRATSVYATEEQFFVPALGLEGFIDVTLEAEYAPANSSSPSASRKKVLVPLELKTGGKQDFRTDHMGQLSLYTLMARAFHGDARFGEDEDKRSGKGGIILYMNGEKFENKFLAPSSGELKTLVAMRNELVGNILSSDAPRGVINGPKGEVKVLAPSPTNLPRIDNSFFDCKSCFSKRDCMLYKASEIRGVSSAGEGSGQREEADWKVEMVEKRTGHLTDEHLKYFREWDRMIDLELAADSERQSDAWLVSSAEREEREGSTVSGMVWNRKNWEGQQVGDYEEGCLLTFERAQGVGISTLAVEVGRKFVVSTDGTIASVSSSSGASTRRSQLSIAKGVVEAVGDTFVSLRCKREDGEKIKTLSDSWGMGEVPKFRLDANVWRSGGGTLRDNLGRLFKLDGGGGRDDFKEWKDDENARSLREIVIDYKEPR